MTGPVAALLDAGAQLHLQHGPIDLLIGADPAPGGKRQRAFAAAATRFETLLDELVAELPLLRTPVAKGSPNPSGSVAMRMVRAVRQISAGDFVTPMAAVAGSVADEVLAAMLAATPLRRAYVNNGGDIALHLSDNAEFSLAMAGLEGQDLGRICIGSGSGIGGIATSGQAGRSLSMGIADSVTVLAANGAAADVAATLIANAVDLPGHPSVLRCAAVERQQDSDLGNRAVVSHVGKLSLHECELALHAGAVLAEDYFKNGSILGTALFLRGAARVVGVASNDARIETRMVEHA